jgi:SAM-dependent methyltransferase
VTTFGSTAEHYDRFMGRYTVPLARALADGMGVAEGMRVVDVGCGPGGLTAELAARVGAGNIAAIDPASQFVAACAERHPGADVREGVAEALSWDDDSFDAALACLVIAFMKDPDAGVGEMARVTKPGGKVGTCMWDIATGGMTMLRMFWEAMRVVKPETQGELDLPGTREGDIAERMERVGLREVSAGSLTVSVEYAGFDDFWEPFTHAVGPSGQALAALEEEQKATVREALRAELPDGPFTLDARAWSATGTV